MSASRSRMRADHVQDEPAVLLVTSSGRVVAATDAAARLVARPSDALRGLGLSQVFAAGTDGVHAWLEPLAELREPPPPLVLEFSFVRGDGTRLALEGVLYAIRTGHVPAEECVAGLRLRPKSGLVVRAELLAAQRALIERVAAGADAQSSLREVAVFAERVLPGESFCMITPVSASGEFGVGVAPGLPAELSRLQAGRQAGEAWSPGTIAAGSGDRLVVPDLSVEPAWAGFAESMQRHGIIAVWSQPVQAAAEGRVSAVVEILLPVRRPASRVDIGLLEELSGLVRLSFDLHALVARVDAGGKAQRQAEAVARDRSRLLNAVVDTALDAVISIDQQGKVTLWNRQAQVLFGWTSEEAVGRPLSELIIPAELVRAHEEGMDRFRRTGYGRVLGRRIEITGRDRAGRRFPVELSINLIPGDEGHFSAFLRDISDRRRAEAAVKSSEERLKLVVDAASDGFWDFRLDGGPSMISDRCASMLGREPESVPALMPAEHPLVHADDRASVSEAWRRHLQGHTPRYESEHRRLHADGSWRWIRDRGKVIERDPGGTPLRVVGTQTDVTDRRALEASLGSAERLESLGLLAGGFAQELDTGLSVIRAHASLAGVSADLPPGVAESMEVVQLQVARAKAMARSLLDLAPREAAARREVVRAVDILREVLQLMRPTLPRTVEVMLEDRAGGEDWVVVDPAGLQQALVNLLLRACESVGHAGRVIIRTEVVEGKVMVSCVDSGGPLGIGEISRAFEALGADGSLLGRAALGMAAVRRFADAMGGRAELVVDGEGNRVRIELPVAPDPSLVKASSVLVHEDHPLLRPMLKEALTAAGHRVVAVEHPSAIEMAWESAPQSLLLLDDAGWRAVAGEPWARMTQRSAGGPKLIVMTDETSVPGLPTGAVRLRRPFSWEALAEAIRTCGSGGGA